MREEVPLCPRWCVTDMPEVKYITGYQTSHVFVETQYEKTENGMHFRVTAPSGQIACHILLPDNVSVAYVSVNQKPISFTPNIVGESNYIDFTIDVPVETRDFSHYQKCPTTDIQIDFVL